MNQNTSPLINPAELVKIREHHDLVLVDVRTGPDSKASYLSKHLASAVFVDLNDDLADIKAHAADGGRHPLPSPASFAKVLERCGITRESYVVAYDDKNGANAAARFWWMLRAAGHAKVSVLNGGFDFAVNAGFPVRSGEEALKDVESYELSEWSLPIATVDEVDATRRDKDSLVIDVREKERFDGIREPIDLIAGHIPGAVNIPFAENLGSDGFYLSAEELREKYSRISADKQDVIVHCGSGVTACHTLLAFDHAGLEIPRLYVGSWSEWSRQDRPIGKKD
jgi:thiosulfate/3-mercaptopyruvate sulfurtransferase